MSAVVVGRVVAGLLIVASAACWLGACGSDSADTLPPTTRTAEECKVDVDCKTEPAGRCKDSATVIHFDVPKCESDGRCSWTATEERCGLMCQDGYCVSALAR